MNLINTRLCLLGVLALTACSPAPEPVPEPVATVVEQYEPSRDYFTFSDTGSFSTRHLALDLDVDFERRQLVGSVTLFMTRLEEGATAVVLDTRDIEVSNVEVGLAGGPLAAAEWAWGEQDAMLGRGLAIRLPEGFEPAGEFLLRVVYRTDPGATALQWLEPALTSGGEHPFLFTQSQSIHARSWIPLQDTPSQRITYEAVIGTPPGLLALMSADNDPAANRDGEYRFQMPQPIPSYLIALAVGNVFFAPVGEDTGVYAEPAILDAAAREFAETQEMLERVEERYGPYQWGRYDLLILPPSFPYGGMENPRLSFITPSVIAGDRSLVSLIAHELAHSWSGNLVTNRTWRDIWLNEGFTSYLDARVMEMLFGKERADEERNLAYQGMVQQFEWVSPEMQPLAPELRQADPDEAQGSVYYAKGQLLLETMEQRFGRDVFDSFLAEYFNHFQWQSITTEQFLGFLEERLFQTHPGLMEISEVNEWLYRPGIPAGVLPPLSASFERAESSARALATGELQPSKLSLEGWSPQSIVKLIDSLPDDIDPSTLSGLDEAAGLSQTGNAEIARAWFTRVARWRFEPAYSAMEVHLKRYGRTWLISGVYRELASNGVDGELAKRLFSEARGGYHPLTVMAIETILRRADRGNY